MKTWQDIEELLRELPRTQNGEGSLAPFYMEYTDEITENFVTDKMYNALKKQIDFVKQPGRVIAVRVFPESIKRKYPDQDGIHRNDAYFRLTVCEGET